MKISLLLSMLTIVQLWATESYSQSTKLTLKFEDVKIVDALREIENQSEFYFLYSPKLIDVERKVNIDAEKEPIKEILSNIFGKKVDFFVYDRQIILTPNDLSSPFSEMQQLRISGTVIGKDGSPIAGVNVVVTGTIQGTITDIAGKYSIQVPEGSKSLTFSFIGMEPQEISIGTLTQINATMVESAVGLEEVVVVGYGSQKKKDITGSVASISDTKFADMPISSMSQALVGQIPGLDVVSSGNNPGDGDQILLRGRRSFVASNDPLLILDGMPYYGSINDINPYDIKSVDVLKDASSTAIYGSQGANGVILITTKRGEIGSPKFMLESYVGSKVIYGELPVMTGEQFAARGREAKRAAGSYNDPGINDALDQTIFRPVEYANLKAGKWADYQDMLLQNGFSQKHQLSVIGGTKAIRYNIAGNVLSEEGIIPDSKFDRYSLRTNLDLTLSEKVTMGASTLFTYSIQSNKASSGTLNEALRNSPLGSPYADDGAPRFDPADDAYRVNPMSEYIWDSYRSDNKNWSAFINLFTEVKILPVLTYRINLGTTMNINTDKNSAGSYSIVRRGDIPNANINNSVSNRKIYESILTFDKTFNTAHHLTLTAVQSIQTSRTERSGVAVSSLPYTLSRYYNVGSAAVVNGVTSDLSEWNLLSYVGRLNYGYKSKYLMTVSVRADGATQFSTSHKWGYFPSVALGWRISEEKFMNSLEWISNMKLRLSYGVSGNQAISPYQTQGSLANTTYAWDESSAYGLRPSELANKNLRWESTSAYNIGLDFGFFKGRISGNLELYKTNTYDLLLYRKLPSTTGFDQVLENIGNTNNKGIELGLHTVNIEKSNFTWSSDVSFYMNREQIVELYNGKVDDVGNRWFIGHPIQVYYDFKKIGIWQTEEAVEAATFAAKPGDLKILDNSIDGAITDADRIIIGTREPKFVFDLSNTFNYKNFDLSAKAYIRWGNTTALSQLNLQPINRENQFIVDYWTPDNPTNSFPRPDSRALIQPFGSTQTYRDGSFIRLRQLSFGYTLPKPLLDFARISNARIYFTGDNLFYWTKSEFRDFNIEPESSGDLSSYPATRSYIVGINITF